MSLRNVGKVYLIQVCFMLGLTHLLGATIIVFEDRGDFLSATGATSATGPLPNLGTVEPF